MPSLVSNDLHLSILNFGTKDGFLVLCVSLAKRQFVLAPLIHSSIPIEFECLTGSCLDVSSVNQGFVLLKEAFFDAWVQFYAH